MLNFGGKRKGNTIAINSKGEFDVFGDVVSYSEDQVFEEMKDILNNEKNSKDKRKSLMNDVLFKHGIISDMEEVLDELNSDKMEANETILIPITGPEEAELLSVYAAKMLSEFLSEGFSPKDKNYKEKANKITYSGTIFEKLSDIANKSKTSDMM